MGYPQCFSWGTGEAIIPNLSNDVRCIQEHKLRGSGYSQVKKCMRAKGWEVLGPGAISSKLVWCFPPSA
eukprot:3047010-Pyramimonas_sp.AAC.1